MRNADDPEFFSPGENKPIGEYSPIEPWNRDGGEYEMPVPEARSDYRETFAENHSETSAPAKTVKKTGLIDRIRNLTPTNIASAVSGTVATVATTVAVSGVVMLSGIMAPQPDMTLSTFDVGPTYVTYEAEVGELDEGKAYEIVVSSPYETFRAEAEEGINRNTVTGLRPNLAYTFSFVGEGGELDGERTYYQSTFYTPKETMPTTLLTMRENTTGTPLSVDCDIYLSDYKNTLQNPVCSLINNGKIVQTIPLNEKKCTLTFSGLSYGTVCVEISGDYYEERVVAGSIEQLFTSPITYSLGEISVEESNAEVWLYVDEPDFIFRSVPEVYTLYNGLRYDFEVEMTPYPSTEPVTDTALFVGFTAYLHKPNGMENYEVVVEADISDDQNGSSHQVFRKSMTYKLQTEIALDYIFVNENETSDGYNADLRFLFDNYDGSVLRVVNETNEEIVTASVGGILTVPLVADVDNTLTYVLVSAEGQETVSESFTINTAHCNEGGPEAMIGCNPSDILYTYNQDGTVNLFVATGYDASVNAPDTAYAFTVFRNVETGDGEEDYSWTKVVDYRYIGTDRYAVIRNVTLQSFQCINIHGIVYVDGVAYETSMIYPSGGLIADQPYYSVNVDTEENTVSVTINATVSGNMRVTMHFSDGTSDTFTAAPSDSISIPSGKTVADVTIEADISYSCNDYVYDAPPDETMYDRVQAWLESIGDSMPGEQYYHMTVSETIPQ